MRGTPKTFTGFRDGVNLTDPPYSLSDREARDARNVFAAGRGDVRKRNGNVSFAATSSVVDSLFAGTVTSLLIAQRAGALETVSTAGVVASLASGLSTTAQWEWVAAPVSGGQGPYFGVNGVDPPRYVSGLGAGGLWTASAGSLPNGTFIKSMANRVIVAGDAANPSRVYGSKILDPRVFASPDGWAVDLDSSDGLPITGIGSVGPYLLVFKETKTFLIYDLDTGANRRLTDSVGCIAHRSISETPKGTFWLSKEGIYQTNGQSVERISLRVQPLLEAMVASNLKQANGIYFRDHYYLCISTAGSENNLILDHDLTLDCWWVHTNPSSQLAVWKLSSGTVLVGGRAGASRIDTYFVNGVSQDAGVNFSAYWSGPHQAFGSPYVRKRLRRLHLDGKGSLTVSLAKDFSSVQTVVAEVNFGTGLATTMFGGSDTFGGSGLYGDAVATIQEAIVYTLGAARAFGLTFSNSGPGSFTLESYTMSITDRKN